MSAVLAVAVATTAQAACPVPPGAVEIAVSVPDNAAEAEKWPPPLQTKLTTHRRPR